MPVLPSSDPLREAYARFLGRLAVFCLRRFEAWVGATQGTSSKAARRLNRALRALNEAADMLHLEDPEGEFWSPQWLGADVVCRGNRHFRRVVTWNGLYRGTDLKAHQSYQEETSRLQEALDKSEVGTLLCSGEHDIP